MAPAELLAEVRRAPFEAFRLVMANGATYEIHHPDQCMVMAKSVVVGLSYRGDDGLIDQTVTLNPWNVLKAERVGEAVHGHAVA
jgi:hypothetical protein